MGESRRRLGVRRYRPPAARRTAVKCSAAARGMGGDGQRGRIALKDLQLLQQADEHPNRLDIVMAS